MSAADSGLLKSDQTQRTDPDGSGEQLPTEGGVVGSSQVVAAAGDAATAVGVPPEDADRDHDPAFNAQVPLADPSKGDPAE